MGVRDRGGGRPELPPEIGPRALEFARELPRVEAHERAVVTRVRADHDSRVCECVQFVPGEKWLVPEPVGAPTNLGCRDEELDPVYRSGEQRRETVKKPIVDGGHEGSANGSL
jgi:hypothetical protein